MEEGRGTEKKSKIKFITKFIVYKDLHKTTVNVKLEAEDVDDWC